MASRRRILAGFGAISVAGLTGCSGVLRSETRDGEGESIEIVVINETADVQRIGIRAEDADAAALFSRVYRLDPGTTDESAGIETAPATVHAFTPTGAAATWEYSPDPALDCDGQDIGITLAADATIEHWYGC